MTADTATKVPSKPLERLEGNNPNPHQGEEVMTEDTADSGQNDTHAFATWLDLTNELHTVEVHEPDPLSAYSPCAPWCEEAADYAASNPDGVPFAHEVQVVPRQRSCVAPPARVPTWVYPARRARDVHDECVIEPAFCEVTLEHLHGHTRPQVQLFHVRHGQQANPAPIQITLRLEEAAHLASVLAAAVNLAQASGEAI